MYRYNPDIARARTWRRSRLIWLSQGDSTEASQGGLAAPSLTGRLAVDGLAPLAHRVELPNNGCSSRRPGQPKRRQSMAAVRWTP